MIRLMFSGQKRKVHFYHLIYSLSVLILYAFSYNQYHTGFPYTFLDGVDQGLVEIRGGGKDKHLYI